MRALQTTGCRSNASETAKVPTAGSRPVPSQIVCFRLADEEYGFDILRAREIITVCPITRLPEVPEFVIGLINLRGHVIPVIDLRKRLGLPVKDVDEQTRIIVVHVENRTVGIVVDAVTEVRRVSADQLEPPHTGEAGTDHDYLIGIIQGNERLIILLRIEEILSGSMLATAGNSADTCGER